MDIARDPPTAGARNITLTDPAQNRESGFGLRYVVLAHELKATDLTTIGRIRSIARCGVDEWRLSNATCRAALRSKNVMKLRASSLQYLPSLTRLGVQWISRQRQRDPSFAIDKNRHPLPHQGSSWTLSWSSEVRFASPSQIPTGPWIEGPSTTLRMASRINSATLRPDRAAALRSTSSSSLQRYTCVPSMHVNLICRLTFRPCLAS
jgi:hypothetical protein